MLVYRVFPYLESAREGEPYHPLYEHRPQLEGRADHPEYFVWYVCRQPEAACGEAFGNLSRWVASMFEMPRRLGGVRRALAVYELPDNLRICDLDDSHRLVELGLRPTQVVIRNTAVTSDWAHRVWSQTTPAILGRKWQAIQWWSFHRPHWTVLASWEKPKLLRVERLDLEHPAVKAAAASLSRPLPGER